MSEKISEMDDAAALVGDEVLPVVQEGANVKATVAQVRGEAYAGNWTPRDGENLSSSGAEFTAFEESLEMVNTGAATYVPAEDEFSNTRLEIETPGVYRVTMQVVIYTNTPFTRPDNVVYEMGLKGDLTLFVTQGVMHFPSDFSVDEGNFIALSGTSIIICGEGIWLYPFIRAYVPGATPFNWTFDGGLILGIERLGMEPEIGG